MTNMGRPSSGRNRNMRLIVSDEELEWAHRLAEHQGLTVSDVVRLLLRKAHAQLDAKQPKKNAKKGSK